MYVQRITIQQAIDYEVGSSAWAGYIRWKPLQTLAALWFRWRTQRKFARYIGMRNLKLQSPDALSPRP